MKTTVQILTAAAIALTVGCRRVPQSEGDMAQTTGPVVYVAERIRTLDPARPIVQAIAVKDGKIVAVGTREQAKKAVGDAEVVELKGATIVPGLTDAHAHIASLGRSLTVAKLKGTTSIEEIVAVLKKAGPESYQGDWLIGRGWDQNDWPEGQRQFPTTRELDAAFPDTPVFLTRVDGHAAWLNSAGLRRAGISKGMPDPAGGKIVRGADGEATGVLVDNAIDIANAAIPEVTDEQLRKRLVAALQKAAQVGLTSIHDAGMDLRTFTILVHWDAVGALPLRVYAMADGQGKDSQLFLDRGTFKGRHLEMRAVKFLLDGALGSRGAALHEAYSDDPHNKGLLLLTPEELEAKSVAYMQNGFQVCVHAIGDRANTLVLDVLERASKQTGTQGGRHRLEHAQVMRKADIDRMKGLGVIASMQPTHATSDMPWGPSRLGNERIKYAYAWKSMLDAGVPLAFGSDFPVEDPDVLPGLYAARTRQDAQGNPPGGWLPEQKLTGEQAMQAFTTGAAYAAFAEDQRGALKVGMDADFVALSTDPVDGPAPELLRAKVLLTVVDGMPVYRAE